ncbi:MAG TPA: VOC family protein [Stellaceae bacterium]|nr:VOC family protein [Stellaceae bacterium]
MKQAISVITLGVADLPRSRLFYQAGFGWTPLFDDDDVVFYQLAGILLGTWSAVSLAKDLGRVALPPPGALNLAHNLPTREDVDAALHHLVRHGATVLKSATDTFYGGYAAYLADPDGHIWEIAWNPGFTLREDGTVVFGAPG